VIYFAPVKTVGNLPKRTGIGRFDVDGVYEVTSFPRTKGLLPGTYTVWIECLFEPVSPSKPLGVSYIQSGFELPDLEVPLDRNQVIVMDYDVPLAKKFRSGGVKN